MDDLSPVFAVESLTPDIIQELRSCLEAANNEEEQLLIVSQIEKKYNLDDGILLSHFYWDIYLENYFKVLN